MYKKLRDVLGRDFDPDLMPKIEKMWKAFYENPQRYKNTVVVAMVNLWIDNQ